MRPLAIASLLVIATLTACAMPVERPGRMGMTWSRGDNPKDGAKLILGREGTDDVRLTITCRPHSGEVLLTVVGGRQPPAVIELQSGKLLSRHAGAGFTDAGLGTFTQVKIAVDDPVLRTFADTGKLTVVFDDRRILAPNGFAPGHDFLSVCRRRPG